MPVKQSVLVTAPARKQSLVLSFPVFVALELTSYCNNRCSGCGNVFAQERSREPLSADEWVQILQQIAPHATRLKLTGGEPTLHPSFERILYAIQRMDMPFALFTNARWLNPDALVSLLRATPQCTGLLVSLHGATTASHDAFTGVPGSFDESCANIQLAVAAGIHVTTSTVISAWNWHELLEVVALSRTLGADHAVFNRYLGSGVTEAEPAPSQLCMAIETLERVRANCLDQAVKFGNCIPQCFKPSASSGCLAGVAYCTIDPWGNMRPCNHAPLLCGNLLEEPVQRIWNGDAMNHWRSMIPNQCWSCSALPHCHGGCRAVALLQGKTKDPLVRVPFGRRQPTESTDIYQALTLHSEARPRQHFALRKESFGLILIRGSRILPLAKDAGLLLDACDGTQTLLEIRDRFGQSGMNLIGQLLELGFLELE
jgi:radical SAM protein with 4Fe4S-binding SPASM domain